MAIKPEQRQSQRHRTLLGGKIVFNAGRSVLDGVVRNLSETGARIQTENALAPPPAFRLDLPDGRSFECVVVWRAMGSLGVQFVG